VRAYLHIRTGIDLYNLLRGGEMHMKKIEVYSKKLGKTMTVEARKGKPASAGNVVGWSKSGWSRSGGW